MFDPTQRLWSFDLKTDLLLRTAGVGEVGSVLHWNPRASRYSRMSYSGFEIPALDQNIGCLDSTNHTSVVDSPR